MIQLRPENPEELRKRLRDTSNVEVRRFGDRARKLSDPKMNFGATELTLLSLKSRGRNGEGDTRLRVGKAPIVSPRARLRNGSRAGHAFSLEHSNSAILM